MFTDRNVRQSLAFGMLAGLAVLVLAVSSASAEQSRLLKVVFPVPTEDIAYKAGWHRTGTIVRNLYPQADARTLNDDLKPKLEVTLTIESPSDVVFLPELKQELTVKIPADSASATFEVAIQAGGKWRAGVQPRVKEGPVTVVVNDNDPPAGYGTTFEVKNIPANVKAAQVLSQLDIDGDSLPDGAPDSDGDGLPDNWEQGGYRSWQETSEELGAGDRLVKLSAPTAIGPGTPPTFVLNRQAVTTTATNADSDVDGLSDFVEAFGLKFVDRNGNGVLDSDEWEDLNGDGLPSVGEGPKKGIDSDRYLLNNFAGFMFTDPSSGDTDGDGFLDSEDAEALINPKTFGVDRGNFARVDANDESKADLDNDGLGNGADFGNDLAKAVDSPDDLSNLIRIFRKNYYQSRQYEGMTVIPESVIEDLIGADWDGNGLYRVTDVRNLHTAVTSSGLETQFGANRFLALFYVGSHPLYSPTVGTTDDLENVVTVFGEKHLGLGIQDLLVPDQRSLPFFPDIRIWTILYAWRVPGFDIDGNGFVGGPDIDAKGLVDDIHEVATGSRLDGQITSPLDFSNCGVGATQALLLTLLGLSAMKATIAPRMRRRQG